MSKHIVSSYDKDIEHLRSAISDMLELISEQIFIIQNETFNPDNTNESSVQEIRLIDTRINNLYKFVTTTATNMLVLRQPMGVDLRIVISAIRMSVTIERIGDLVKSSARVTNTTISNFDHSLYNLFLKIVETIEKMVGMIKASWANMNLESLDELPQCITQVDALYSEVIDNLLIDGVFEHLLRTNKIEYTRVIIQTTSLAKKLERIADHIAKFARAVRYIISGSEYLE